MALNAPFLERSCELVAQFAPRSREHWTVQMQPAWTEAHEVIMGKIKGPVTRPLSHSHPESHMAVRISLLFL